jgi:dihydrofolate reductase
MGKLVFGMMQSLDGYVAGVAGGPELSPPGAALHRYFNDHVRGLAGSLYGRRMYEIMRYWDEDRPEWRALEHDFAAAWRAQPKWVASRSLKSVGANAMLVGEDVEAFVRGLKADVEATSTSPGPIWRGASPNSVLSTSIVSTSARSCLAAASRISPAPGRRSA